MDDHAYPAPVKAVLDAATQGDRDAFLAAFTDDGVVDDWGRSFRGREEIGRWSDQEFIGKKVTLAVEDVVAEGGAIVVGAAVGGEGFNGPSHFSFEVEGDHVSRMTIRE